MTFEGLVINAEDAADLGIEGTRVGNAIVTGSDPDAVAKLIAEAMRREVTAVQEDGYSFQWLLGPRLHGPLVAVRAFIEARCTGWTQEHILRYFLLPDGHCTCRCHAVGPECCEHCLIAGG